MRNNTVTLILFWLNAIFMVANMLLLATGKGPVTGRIVLIAFALLLNVSAIVLLGPQINWQTPRWLARHPD